ncbi:MAG: Hsp70 family protein, partial [Myxococcota bacterium]
MSLEYDRPVGIDLGTTNSELACVDPYDRAIEVLRDRFGRATHASAVAASGDGFVTGRAARKQRSKGRVLESMKRRMGESVRLRVGDAELTPEEASSFVLKDVVAAFTEQAEPPVEGATRPVRRAVITVPAYFDAPQLQATKRAGELAGLEVLALLHEPTAAAMFHRYDGGLTFEGDEGTLLVYDLGGGTFDVSILRCVGDEYQVLAIAGDNYLGGDDFDRRFAEVLRKRLVAHGYALDLDAEEHAPRLQKLRAAARAIKERFASEAVVSYAQENVLEDLEGEPVDLELEMSQSEYVEAIGDLLDTTFECCERALADAKERAGLTREALSAVVLVGGSTRLPAIVDAVKARLCAHGATLLQREVDTCVAQGAALHAASLGGHAWRRGERAVSIASAVSTSGEQLSLRVDTHEGGAPAGERVRVKDDAGNTVAEIEETPGRLKVPVDAGPQRFVLEAFGEAFPLLAHRGETGARPSKLSQPGVLAKDLSLEVIKGGRLAREVLFARGTPLPAEGRFAFETADQSGTVVLRLLQQRLPLHTLAFEVSDIAVGSPVDLELRVDETMNIECNASVAGQSLWVQVQRPEGGDLEAAAAHRLAEGEALQERLWGHEGTAFRRAFATLSAALAETLRQDRGRAAHLLRRLEQLLDNFREEGVSLSPPLFRFEALVDAIRREALSAGGTLGQDAATWTERIDTLQRRGQQAYDDVDAGGYRLAYDEAQALKETLTEERFAAKGELREEHWLSRFKRAARAAAALEEQVQVFALAIEPPELRERQLAERDRLLAALSELRARLEGFEAGGVPALREAVHGA